MSSLREGLLLVIYTSTSLFGLYKLKSSPFGPNPSFVLGFVAYGAGFLLWLRILKLLPLSVAFPIAAGALMIGTQLVGLFALGERASLAKLGGIVLIFTGIVVLEVSRRGP